MAEFMGQNGLEFIEGQSVDQAQPDNEVGPDRPQQPEQGRLEEGGGVDLGDDENAVRHGGAGVAAQPAKLQEHCAPQGALAHMPKWVR